jgi:nucleotide-binding universal stress UspA family protein
VIDARTCCGGCDALVLDGAYPEGLDENHPAGRGNRTGRRACCRQRSPARVQDTTHSPRWIGARRAGFALRYSLRRRPRRAAPDHVERDEQGRVRAYLDQQEDAVKREALEYLRAVEAQVKRQRPDLQVSLDVRIGDPAAGIAMAEIALAADLVVMATHGRTGTRRAVLGSVAGAVLTAGSVPVLLVTPAASAATEHQPTSTDLVATR